MLYARVRKRWKTIIFLTAIWFVFLFPIPFLPLWGLRVDENTVITVVAITVIVSVPFTFLAIFMNDGEKGPYSLDEGESKSR